MVKNWNCDGSGPCSEGSVKLLPLGGGANLILCKNCWNREMEYRKTRNLSLGTFAQYDIVRWEDGKLYE